MQDDQIIEFFKNGVRAATGLSLGANVPNALSLPHFVAGGFKILLALGVASNYEFKELKEAQNAAANAPAEAAGGEEAKEEEAAPEEEEEEEDDISAGGLFGSDSDSD